jgi:hypothetical protein
MLLVVAPALGGHANRYGPGMNTHEAVKQWIDAWSQGWPERLAEVIARVYGENAVFRSQPFREPHLGPAGVAGYAQWAFEEQDGLEFWFGEAIVGEGRAAVEYWAVITTDDVDNTIAGIAVIHFRRARDGPHPARLLEPRGRTTHPNRRMGSLRNKIHPTFRVGLRKTRLGAESSRGSGKWAGVRGRRLGWTRSGSNRLPPPCHGGALPSELRARSDRC